MLKQRTKIFIFFLYLGDLAATVLAFLCAYWFRGIFPQESYAKLFPFAWYNNLLLAIFPAWSFLFYLMGLYRNWRGQGFWKETWELFKAVFIPSLLLGFTVFALKYQFVSRVFILLFVIFDFFFVLAARTFIRKMIIFFNRKIERFRRILILEQRNGPLPLSETSKGIKIWDYGFLAFFQLEIQFLPKS